VAYMRKGLKGSGVFTFNKLGFAQLHRCGSFNQDKKRTHNESVCNSGGRRCIVIRLPLDKRKTVWLPPGFRRRSGQSLIARGRPFFSNLAEMYFK
jgi:hypothetical protein